MNRDRPVFNSYTAIRSGILGRQDPAYQRMVYMLKRCNRPLPVKFLAGELGVTESDILQVIANQTDIGRVVINGDMVSFVTRERAVN